MPLPHIDGPEAFQAVFAVSRETVQRLELYAELLRHWSKTHDLVAPSTLADVWHRHFADSAQLVALAPDVRDWVDLGAGAGFPGLVLAIMSLEQPAGTRRRITLVESNQKKCAFLAEVARRCGAPVDILMERIENKTTHHKVRPSDRVTARALAPLGKLLGYASPLFSPSTVGLFLKGRGADAEVAAALSDWRFEHRLIPSLTDPDAAIVEIKQLGTSERG